MTEAKYVVALIERDVAEKIPVTVLLHEIPVLEMVHSKAVIRPADIDPVVASREVDLEDEYDRLANQYGMDENGIPFVERVYGRLDEFVRKVEEGYGSQTEAKQKRRANKPADSVTDDESNAG